MTPADARELGSSTPIWRRAGLWIFFLALAVRLGLIFTLGTYRIPERTEIVKVAIALAEEGRFADAYGPGTGPSAHTSPLYPLLLSGIFRIFGTGQAGEVGQEILSSIFGALVCALLPALAAAFGMGRATGIWAGLFAAAVPVNFWSETKGSFEGSLAALLLLLVCLCFALAWERERFFMREACVSGVAAGAAFLTSPSVLPIVVLLLAIGGWLFRTELRRYAKWAGVVAGVSFALLLPWAIRNEYALGSPVFTRLSLGLNLSFSNNDDAHADYHENETLMFRLQPMANPEVRDEVKRMGEVAYNRQETRKALSWMRTHPTRFLKMTAERIALFWFPRMVRTPQTILIRLEAIAGMIGFALLLRTGKRAKWIIGAVWLAFPLIYYVVEAFARYRYPIDWSFLLLGSFAATHLVAAGKAPSEQRHVAAPESIVN